VEGYFERGNEISGFIKYWETVDWLHNWQLLELLSSIMLLICVTIHMQAMGKKPVFMIQGN
jgi:hypothetical protein